MQKKFAREGIDVRIKKSGSVNPVIMVKQFANIMNDIKDVNERQARMQNSSVKQRAALKHKHKSVSASAIKRDLRKMKVVPKLKLCDQCRWHKAVNAVNTPAPNSGTGRKSSERLTLVSSLPKRVKIKSASISPPPLSKNEHKEEEENKKLTATAEFPKTKYESLNPFKSNRLASTKKELDFNQSTEKVPPSARSKQAKSIKSVRSRTSASVFHGSTFHKSFNIERDLSKYSKNLNYVTTERMLQGFTNSALGRRLTALKARNKILGRLSNKWDKERDAIKNVDWQASELYEAYQQS